MNASRSLRLLRAACVTLLVATRPDVPAEAAVGAPDPAGGASARGLEGRWFLDFDRADGAVQLSTRRGSGRHHSESSSPFRLEDFRGLQRPSGAGEIPARFSLPRDAGTFDFEGHLDATGGSGRFRFTANLDFERAWTAAGRAALSEDQVYAMALHDVSRAFIQELRALGYADLPADKLIAMRIHGATPEFVRELKGLGYANLPVDQVIAFRIHGVTPA
ncbi:MAG: hypothetical protein M3R62_03795, partial [Acidobacteriota bacterium]|nr:hypothetical protein [Acidobacteriota bacterium]